jgi:hypothetical protein
MTKITIEFCTKASFSEERVKILMEVTKEKAKTLFPNISNIKLLDVQQINEEGK